MILGEYCNTEEVFSKVCSFTYSSSPCWLKRNNRVRNNVLWFNFVVIAASKEFVSHTLVPSLLKASRRT